MEPAFVKNGFQNWKKAHARFQSHQDSEGHREAVFKMQRHGEPGVQVQLNDQLRKAQALHRKMFMKELSSLLRQGLAIRGHDEMEGNLM